MNVPHFIHERGNVRFHFIITSQSGAYSIADNESRVFSRNQISYLRLTGYEQGLCHTNYHDLKQGYLLNKRRFSTLQTGKLFARAVMKKYSI